MAQRYYNYSPGLAIDGDWGSCTKKCMQRFLWVFNFYHRECDGDFGDYSKIGLQKFLASSYGNWKYTGAIDGIAGQMTWDAWNEYLDSRGWDYINGTNYAGNQNPTSGLVKDSQGFLNWSRYSYGNDSYGSWNVWHHPLDGPQYDDSKKAPHVCEGGHAWE